MAGLRDVSTPALWRRGLGCCIVCGMPLGLHSGRRVRSERHPDGAKLKESEDREDEDETEVCRSVHPASDS
jgi:hypothetical protein